MSRTWSTIVGTFPIIICFNVIVHPIEVIQVFILVTQISIMLSSPIVALIPNIKVVHEL
ncbi:hypothetical protein C8R44DRAFT_882628 [Mycena epipterygia]|nr:hypothetical protein C8R44DRAFT_882628 [Mycena epipterygia]